MGQREILQLFQKHPERWFASKEISEILKVSSGSIGQNLVRLKNFNNPPIIKYRQRKDYKDKRGWTRNLLEYQLQEANK
jgi:hypothetical protein